MNNKDVIQVEKVFKNFSLATGDLKVLHDINFTVREGEFVILIGSSGCGKTTLLHMLTGWDKPTSGQILLDGSDIYLEPETKRTKIYKKRLVALNQQQLWIKHLSAIENVEVPQMLAGVSKGSAHQRAKKLLELFNMSAFANHKPEDLSGGQQQMFNMLRALINNPDIIIADEPTGNMDHKSATMFMDTLKLINKKLKRTIILTTHDLSFVDYSTKTILILDGKVKDTIVQDPDFQSASPIGDILDIGKVKASAKDGKE